MWEQLVQALCMGLEFATSVATKALYGALILAVVVAYYCLV